MRPSAQRGGKEVEGGGRQRKGATERDRRQ